ncbi:MAG: GNAT family N-acetyltransferase [Pikeienuella sp.]
MARPAARAEGRDGPPEIRYLSAADGAAIAAHLMRLSPEDRRFRFFCAVGDAGIRMHCGALRAPRLALIGAFRAGRLIGFGELALPRLFGPGGAEFALSIDEGERRRGTGALLLATALAIARNRIARRVALRCLGDNHAMLGLARRSGARLRCAQGEVEAALRAPGPNLRSLLAEARLTFGALTGAFRRLSGRPGLTRPGMPAT